jgi:putative oxidoreductase
LAAAAQSIDRLQPVLALAIRFYIAYVFLRSGLTKIEDWNLTVALLENEYRVPFLPPPAAALLVVGLGTRVAALALFVLNIVALISYPDLSDAGLEDHLLWGALMLVLAVSGPERFSLDRALSRQPVVTPGACAARAAAWAAMAAPSPRAGASTADPRTSRAGSRSSRRS